MKTASNRNVHAAMGCTGKGGNTVGSHEQIVDIWKEALMYLYVRTITEHRLRWFSRVHWPDNEDSTQVKNSVTYYSYCRWKEEYKHTNTEMEKIRHDTII